ncbi:branched-chain amino acid ABC transporter permease [Ottowia thiooxydans]|uniref:Branched-chain amino acid transport system permease protein n=1 Tax=Ottowia thiooxydans TaxID=219182 RepID=A0ABV2Q7Y3_9BURK
MIQRTPLLLALVFFLALVSAPFWLNAYPQTLLTEILIFGLFAASIDLLAGVAGRTSLGHGAIFGTAAYVVAWCQTSAGIDPWVAAALGVAAATLLALVFGLLAVRTEGVYFLLLTLALGMVVWGVAYRWVSVTGAESGLRGIARPEGLEDNAHFYWFVLAAVALTFFALRSVVNSQFGLALRGIKQSSTRMGTLGYNVPLTLTLAFTVSGFVAGVAGVLGVYLNSFVSPSSVALAQSTKGLLMAILGGVGTLWGGFIGAGVMIALENLVSFYTERWAMVLGAMFVLTMLFAPTGLLGTARMVIERLKKGSTEKSQP